MPINHIKNAITKANIIKRENLSDEFYFNSLIEEALILGAIDEIKSKKIQMDCLSLLSKKCNSYSGGASSSIRTELAEEILKSTVYVIGIGLKSFDTPDIALASLFEQGAETIYAQGKRRLGTKIKMAKQLHRMVLGNMISTANFTYTHTLTGGINGFFKLYNPEYSAHLIQITADYPTANPINDFVGIEFIVEYLQAIFYENTFCSLFDTEIVEKLLNDYSADYRELIVNIYSIVLNNAIRCVMLRKSVFEPTISENEMEILANRLAELSKTELNEKVKHAFVQLFEEANITSEPLRKYMLSTLPNITTDMFQAIRNKNHL